MLSVCLAMLDDPDQQREFLEYYERYKRLVYHTAFKYLQDESLAYDASQETFLYFAKKFTTVNKENRHELAGWFVVCSRSRALDILRARHNEVPGWERDPDADVDPAPPPEDAVIGADQAGRLIALVESLDPIYRDALNLRRRGMSYAEIAEATGVEVGTVRKRVARARAILWEELHKDEE